MILDTINYLFSTTKNFLYLKPLENQKDKELN
jgi:hypothetical protein